MHITAASRSERGPRTTNQDSHFEDLGLGLLVVADGMGGHNAGEIASRLAVDTLVEFVRNTADNRDLTWPFPFDPSQPKAANRMSVGIRLANQKVYDGGRRDPKLAGMGTTLVAALVDGERVIIGHVGDSRAYRWRAGALQQMTKDDTWLMTMLGLDARTHSTHPMRHVLTNGIGMRADVTPSLSTEALRRGDRWLLCSDGVHGYLDPEALGTALALPAVDAAADQIVRDALAAGTTDNATVIVLKVE